MIYRLGLIGYPLMHSLSPELHHTALQSAGLEGTYTCFPVLPAPAEASQQKIAELLKQLRAGALQGLNVTIPFKEAVISLLDELTPTAERIGAVNTLFMQNGRLTGDNTDAEGFRRDLARTEFDNHHPGPGTKNALVLGAGGAARAVVHALVGMGWRVAIAARREAQALAIQQANLPSVYPVEVLPFDEAGLSGVFDLVVNATPLGSPPYERETPWPEGVRLPVGCAIYDLVYTSETPLVREARSTGIKAATGLGMLVQQAALSFQIWTGHTANQESMRAAACAELRQRQKGKDNGIAFSYCR